MSAVVSSCTDEVTARDIAVIEAVLNQIDRKNSFRECLAYWKLAMRLFKKFDLAFTCLEDRTRLEKGHKEILSSMLVITDWIVQSSGCLNDQELGEFHLSREALQANLQFLRRKFSQWYIPCDDGMLSRVAAAIEQ